MKKRVKSEEEWARLLTPEQFAVLRKKATEAPFMGAYLHNKEKGMYVCVACANPLFFSNTKFESGSGWPSFWDVIGRGNIKLKPDSSLGMSRTEVVCAKCEGHLGHLFEDGPQDKTGMRYCINSSALGFKPQEK